MTVRLALLPLACTFSTMATATELTLTGDVDQDFAAADRVETVTDGASPDLTPGSTVVSGLDVRSVFIHYDEPSDTLYVGVKTWVAPTGDAVIFGDVDGNGNPSALGGGATGVDEADLGGGESFTLILDTDDDGTVDVLAGVPVGSDIFGARVATPQPVLFPVDPSQAYDADVPGTTITVGPSPTAGAPHFEMAITGLDLAGLGGEFGVWAYTNAADARSYGQDTIPDSGDFQFICFGTDGDGDGVPACDNDCDDADPTVFPGADELCDGLDNNCSGSLPADEVGYPNGAQCFDNDGDGLTNGEEAALGTDPDVVDFDGDGLSDGDEVLVHGTDPTLADTDGGGESDGDEIAAGSDPTMQGDDDGDNDGLTNDEEALLGTDGSNFDTDNDGLSDGVEVNDTLTSPTLQDSDGDGLVDGLEVNRYETNPLKADTDDGGASDFAEVQFGTDPNDPSDDGLALDEDEDGISDIDETDVYNTDPTVADSDGDGLTDGEEVFTTMTDPNLEDTDGDGLSDFAEVRTHETDPTLADTDGGSVDDGDELANGTDPLDGTDDVRDESELDVEYWGGGHATSCQSAPVQLGWLMLLVLPWVRRRR